MHTKLLTMTLLSPDPPAGPVGTAVALVEALVGRADFLIPLVTAAAGRPVPLPVARRPRPRLPLALPVLMIASRD